MFLIGSFLIRKDIVYVSRGMCMECGAYPRPVCCPRLVLLWQLGWWQINETHLGENLLLKYETMDGEEGGGCSSCFIIKSYMTLLIGQKEEGLASARCPGKIH